LRPSWRCRTPSPTFARVGAPFNGNTDGTALACSGTRSSAGRRERWSSTLQGVERIAADSAEFVKELPALRQRALEGMRQLHLRQYMTALRSRAEIVDNRDQIYKTAAQVVAETPVVPGQPR
jgi:uncharacterized protein (DUF885 family)